MTDHQDVRGERKKRDKLEEAPRVTNGPDPNSADAVQGRCGHFVSPTASERQ